MGCEITNITSGRAGISPLVSSSIITTEVSVASAQHGILPELRCSKVLDDNIRVTSSRFAELPKVTSSIVCDIGAGEFVRWALESLQWLGEDNQIGVTKYNTLIASGEWSLEELEIEELL